MPGGDDLEDDFVADELVELSEEEGSLHELDDDSNDYADEPTPAAPVGSTSDAAAVSKKRKRREKEKEKKLKVRASCTLENFESFIIIQVETEDGRIC